MGIFSKVWQKDIKNQSYSLSDKRILSVLGIDVSEAGDRIGEITYFRCLKILSEAMSKLPLKIFKETDNGNEKVKHYLNYLLRTQPNSLMNASTFWGTIELNRNHRGNAYVYIERNKTSGKVLGFKILPVDSVRLYMDDAEILSSRPAIWYQYIDSKTSNNYLIPSDDILHFKSWITEGGRGIVGLAVQDILKKYIDRGLYGNSFITNLTKNGMITDKIIIHYTGGLDTDAKKVLINEMKTYSAEDDGKFITMPMGLSVQNLSSKLVDSQFMELNKYNALQISAAFGINPQSINDFEKGNFANAGIQMEMFYKDTLLPILSNYEQELAIKLFTSKENQDHYFNFNVDAILRGAFKDRIDTYAAAINNCILTPNECREMENRSRKEGGDQLIGNGNYIPLSMAGMQWQKGGEE
ncbi:phage portal protein [Vallitalea guaymasensis]|uniref:phage portal protein n=1 Tax=Vallitalea guaymasensis TaxID=1185412 RepID=UPI000DE21F18|nr:phage portal protein [Vallitalea guaymasensis]